MSLDKLALKTLSRERVELDNLLASYDLQWSDDGGEDAQPPAVELQGFDAIARLPVNTLRLDIASLQDGLQWSVILKQQDAAALLSCWLGGTSVSELPVNLLAGACELWLEHLTNTYPSFNTLEIECVSLLEQSAAIDETQTVLQGKLSGATPTRSVPIYLLGDVLVLTHLLKLRASKKTATCQPRLDLTFLYGQVNFSLAELKQIQTGDILLLPTQNLQQQQCLVLINGRPQWLAHLNERTITLIEPGASFMTNEEKENVESLASVVDENETSVMAEPLSSLEELPLSVQFTLPGESKTVSDLQSLTAGYVFTLVEGAETCIDIGVNGKALGKGQLVNIEGRLGVQVQQWGRDGD